MRFEQLDLTHLYTLPNGEDITYGEWIRRCREFAETNSCTAWSRELDDAVRLYDDRNPWPLYSTTLPSVIDLCRATRVDPSCIFVLGPGAYYAELAVPAILFPNANVYGIDSSPPRRNALMVASRLINNRRIRMHIDDYVSHKDQILKAIDRSGHKITNPLLIVRHPPVFTMPPDIGETVLEGLAQWARYIADRGGSFALTTYTRQEMNRVSSRITSAFPLDYIDRLHVIEHPRGTSPIIQRPASNELRVDGWRLMYPKNTDTNHVGRIYP